MDSSPNASAMAAEEETAEIGYGGEVGTSNSSLGNYSRDAQKAGSRSSDCKEPGNGQPTKLLDSGLDIMSHWKGNRERNTSLIGPQSMGLPSLPFSVQYFTHPPCILRNLMYIFLLCSEVVFLEEYEKDYIKIFVFRCGMESC